MKNQINETKCHICKQVVPVRQDGTKVTHYHPFKGKKKQEVCPGSERSVL